MIVSQKRRGAIAEKINRLDGTGRADCFKALNNLKLRGVSSRDTYVVSRFLKNAMYKSPSLKREEGYYYDLILDCIYHRKPNKLDNYIIVKKSIENEIILEFAIRYLQLLQEKF